MSPHAALTQVDPISPELALGGKLSVHAMTDAAVATVPATTGLAARAPAVPAATGMVHGSPLELLHVGTEGFEPPTSIVSG